MSAAKVIASRYRDARSLARLGAGGGDDRVGDEAQGEAEQDGPGGDHLELGGPRHGEEFDHHVQDRPGGQGQERDAEDGAGELFADQRAQEGRAAADQAEQEQARPGRPLAAGGQRGDDAEPFRRVVRAEADDEQNRQAEPPAAAELPMARPSPKLCRPIPTAIIMDSCAARDRASGVPTWLSADPAVAAPGPSRRTGALRRAIARST